MQHYTYLLINKDNNIRYIGLKSSEHPYNDNYFSSSDYVHAVKNYPVCFDKIILDFFDTRAEAAKEERRLILLNDAHTSSNFYNESVPSEGWDTQGMTLENSASIRKMSNSLKIRWANLTKEEKINSTKHLDVVYEKLRTGEIDIKNRGTGNSLLKGKNRTIKQQISDKKQSIFVKNTKQLWSKEANAKRSKTMMGAKRPEHSLSMKGRINITRDGESRKCKPEELKDYINHGWIEGSTKRKLSIFKLKACPYCGKQGKGPNMTRYHFNKCKQVGIK